MVKIIFKKEFTSPSLGNVWIGRTMKVKRDRAMELVSLGYAELDEKKSAQPIAIDLTQIDEIEETEGEVLPEVETPTPRRRGRKPKAEA